MPRDNSIRLQKYLSERGIASRRTAGDWIRQGRVYVNGACAVEPGQKIDPDTSQVCVDGNMIPCARAPSRTIALNKPRGYICSRRSQSGRTPTIYELDGIDPSLRPAGRLDKESEGLLIMSNDGDLIHRITHPSFENEKVYEVSIAGPITPGALSLLRSRQLIDGYRIQRVGVTVLRQSKNASTLQFTLSEGRNRQLRKMCARACLQITTLRRVAVCGLKLHDLTTGKWRSLAGPELQLLLSRNA